MELNENQKNHILSTFQYIDKLFSDIEQILSAARAPAFFKPYFPDIQPERQDALLEGIGEFRAVMRKILETLEIAPPQPHVGALRAILTAITFADIALEELNSKHMKGYGAVARDASVELDELVRDLQTSMARLGHLASGETAEERFSPAVTSRGEENKRFHWEES